MKPLIDADILLHEMGWSGQFKDKDSGEEILLGWERVEELTREKVRLICEDVGATEEPTLFLSNSSDIQEAVNRTNRLFQPAQEFVPNFRYARATSKPYKGTRKNPKPHHFHNLVSFFRGNYDTIISYGGLEADDEMGIFNTEFRASSVTPIVCSRDKDLRMLPGFHYSWECGKQRSIGPIETSRIGSLGIDENGKFLGLGLKFFYYQLLAGDNVDNIPGLPGCGHVGALSSLEGIDDERDLFERVRELYKTRIEIGSREYFLEQADLLWIKQERDKGYEIPYKQC